MFTQNLKIVFTVVLVALFMSCKSSTKETTNQSQQRGKQRPAATELLKTMDTNKDGKLSKTEAKGPLEKDFSKIDSNNDGFITKAELENMPKPNGSRPPRQ